MNTLLCKFGIGLYFAVSWLSLPVEGKEMSRKEVLAEAESMAFAKFENMRWNFWGRFWTDGVLWAGVADLAEATGNPKLLEALQKLGERPTKVGEVPYGHWELTHANREKEPHHADDMLVGGAFLYVYEKTNDPAVLANTRLRVDAATASILSKERADLAAKAGALHWQEGLTWYWCDALFMAAPLHARFSIVTGDSKYREAMHLEWKRASDLLYDPEEHLYFRDKNFITKSTKNGKKVFWSRGNGWVMGAFARTIPNIPKEDPQRAWYVKQFKEMSAKMASIQQKDGSWSPSLLDYEQFPYSEMSGTALNCFALAWGVNERLLDEATFRPVVEKAWAALLAARKDNPNGFLGYVQGVGAEPAGTQAGAAPGFGIGTFLLAATQVAKMAPIEVPELPPLSGVPPPAVKR